MMFAQDSTLIGDVDCSGEVNSQDASLILQFVTNVIDELPCQDNMTGLTPDQLQEMIDMMEDQLSINYNGGSFGDFISINTAIETQATSDGFLYGRCHIGGNNISWVKIYCDTFSGNTNIRALFEINSMGSTGYLEEQFLIPIKQGEFFSFEVGGSGDPFVNNVYFIPLESGASNSEELGGSVVDVSQYNDTLYLSDGNYFIIPGISQSNLHYYFTDYGTVTDSDGNIYKTLVYGDQEWMVENLRTNIGSYLDPLSLENTINANYLDSVGYYYSSDDAINNPCPGGWHVSTVSDWEELHYEIFGTNLNTEGGTNSENGFDDNNYEILWSQNEGGTNQSFFNLFVSGTYVISSGDISYPYNAGFWTPTGCNNGNLDKINFYTPNNSSGWTLDVGCTAAYNVKACIRCVKD